MLDSLSEIRLLSQSDLRYRKQILALKQYFTNRGATSLLLDDRTSDGNDLQLHSVPHGVMVLERRRRCTVRRGAGWRSSSCAAWTSAAAITTSPSAAAASSVFPRLVAARERGDGGEGQLASGIDEIDALLGGGIERGSSTLIMGPAGAGKSTLATQYAVAAAKRGERPRSSSSTRAAAVS